MSAQARLFALLWLVGMLGVLSFQLVDLGALIALMPDPEGKPLPFSLTVLRLISVIQPAVLLALAVGAGHFAAPRVGLRAPVAQALVTRGDIVSALQPQIVPALLGGIAGGLAILINFTLWRPYLPPALVSRADELGRLLPPATRLLYGGITEELLLRWGFMSVLVWLIWKLTPGRASAPGRGVFVAAILISSIVFGAGHLPLAAALNHGLTVSLTLYVIVANSLFGVIAGWLFWKRGLESAILAHMVTHVVLLIAMYAAG